MSPLGNLRVTVVQGSIACFAAVLLFYGLADRYLWQDEAHTAVLAARLLKYGRPVAYDGKNLVTTDIVHYSDAEVEAQAADPKAALAFHLRYREFKPDTTWKWQPWGLFAIAAASFKLLGQTTLAARLPFALAGFATVVLLLRLVHRYTGSLRMAVLASLFLIGNPYWILHARQCRYYALSSLFLVLLLLAYLRWQSGGRLGALAFAATGWCWFQVDYGTVWPVLGICFLYAFVTRAQPIRRIVALGAAMAASILPFAYYYELWGRSVWNAAAWRERFLDDAFNLNEYVIPAVLLVGAAILLAWRWKSLKEPERSLAAISVAVFVALAFWIPTVAFTYLRYAIVAEPAAAFLMAWLLVQWCGSRAALVWPAAAICILTPWASLPAHPLVPAPDWYPHNPLFRSEFTFAGENIFGHQPDPNRSVVEYLRAHAAPSDEILINYEDLPLVFYLPNPIRGGVTAFRALDDSRAAPRFVILRYSVDFTNWPVYEKEVARYQWTPIPIPAPDVEWGNNPDPMGQPDASDVPAELYIARRAGN